MSDITICGILSWLPEERRSDRYGMLLMCPRNYKETTHVTVVLNVPNVERMAGSRINLRAEVIEARDSGHIGDIFRGIYPSKPEVGQTFDLGTGTLIVAPSGVEESPVTFGLRPDDGRETDWFDPRILYRLHDQTVRLTLSLA